MHVRQAGRPASPLDLLEPDTRLTPGKRAVRDSVRSSCDRRGPLPYAAVAKAPQSCPKLPDDDWRSA
jgi:hypothetical protein